MASQMGIEELRSYIPRKKANLLNIMREDLQKYNEFEEKKTELEEVISLINSMKGTLLDFDNRAFFTLPPEDRILLQTLAARVAETYQQMNESVTTIRGCAGLIDSAKSIVSEIHGEWDSYERLENQKRRLDTLYGRIVPSNHGDLEEYLGEWAEKNLFGKVVDCLSQIESIFFVRARAFMQLARSQAGL
ncbi:unnamed protein product [Orchesella dallaii]|uniref:Uncharacterized protein n=1 Tax=Orchesella dallaii TaxID=48710 RepID=A0ABP1QJT7_9HEXA